MKRSYWGMERRMADRFDRTRFILDMIDSNLLYGNRQVGGDVFTTDSCWNTLTLCCFDCICTRLNSAGPMHIMFEGKRNYSKLLKTREKGNNTHVEPVLMQGHCISIICCKALIQTQQVPCAIAGQFISLPWCTTDAMASMVNPLNRASNYNFKEV